MEIQRLEGDFTICKVPDYSQVDLSAGLCFVGRTDEENSLICLTAQTPGNALECDSGWRAFRVRGVLDFSLVGILSEISGLLAREKIGLFAVSTYNTDYILTKQSDYERALTVLEGAGYSVIDRSPAASGPRTDCGRKN